MLRALFLFLSSSSSSSGFLDWWIKHRYDEDWILNHSLHCVSCFIYFIWRKGLNVKHKTNQTSQTFGYDNQTKKSGPFWRFFSSILFLSNDIEWHGTNGYPPPPSLWNSWKCIQLCMSPDRYYIIKWERKKYFGSLVVGRSNKILYYKNKRKTPNVCNWISTTVNEDFLPSHSKESARCCQVV